MLKKVARWGSTNRISQ